MFDSICEKLVNDAVRRNIIREENIEECVFGLSAFFTIAINIISALIIGMVMHTVFELALFIIIYKSLRSYVGGSHCKTAVGCYIYSCVMYAVIPLIIKYYPLGSAVTVAVAVASTIIMFVLSPVEALKKPLDDVEKRVFKIRARILVCICLCVFLILHYTSFIPHSYYCSVIFAVTMAVVAYFAISGKIMLNTKKIKLVKN